MARYNVGGVWLPRPFQIRKFSHAGLYYADFKAMLRFYVGILGFQAADYTDQYIRPQMADLYTVGPVIFLRMNTDHHGFNLFPDSYRTDRDKHTIIQQISWDVGTYDELRRCVDYLKEKKVELEYVGRRMPGSNYSVYFRDPDDHRQHLNWNMEQVGWQGISKPLAIWEDIRRVQGFPEATVSDDEEVTRLLSPKTDEAIEQAGHSTDRYQSLEREIVAPLSPRDPYRVEGLLLPRPSRITRPAYIGLYVRDVGASTSFFTEILGFRLSDLVQINGEKVAFLRHGADHHSLCLYPLKLRESLGDGARATLARIAFEVQTYKELKDSIAYFQERGVHVLWQGRSFPGGEYAVDLRDPEGNRVRLFFYMEQNGWQGVSRPADAWGQPKEGLPGTIDPDSDTYQTHVFGF